MAETAKWYVVQTYSAYENTVKATLEKAIEKNHLQDVIQEVVIPMETVEERSDNGIKTYDRKVFPGYVLVKMILNDDTWYIIKNVRGATGFVPDRNKPIPLSDEEAYALGIEKRVVIVGFKEGDRVSIIDGPFASQTGIVEKIDLETGTVSVILSIFGRDLSAEMTIDQLEACSQD